MDEVFLRLVDMPETVRAFTMLDDNEGYNVYINARLGLEMQTKALYHELEHIRCGDLHSFATVEQIERCMRKKGM